MTHGWALHVRALADQLLVEPVDVRYVERARPDAVVPFGPRDEEKPHGITIQDAEVVLLIVDLEAEYVAIYATPPGTSSRGNSGMIVCIKRCGRGWLGPANDWPNHST